jgi:hypothetical protein
VLSGTATYALIGAVGALLGHGPWRHVLAVVALAGILLVYVSGERQAYARLGIQANRRLAERGNWGMVYFGALLGIGFLTEVSTPLVAAGVVLSLASTATWGAAYGLGFALGRWRPAVVGLVAGYGRGGPGEVVRRMTLSGGTRRRVAGVATTVGALAVYVATAAL